jgi:lysophospholipase L1-like esterase
VATVENEIVFNGTAGPATDSTPQSLAGRFYELGLDGGLGGATAFANQLSGNVTLTPLIYANDKGAAANTVSMTVRMGEQTILGNLALNPNTVGAPVVVGPSITIPKSPWTPGNYLTADFRVNAGAAPANGSNLTLAGLRISDGGSGLQVTNTPWSGAKVEDYINDTISPLQNLQQLVALTDSDTAFVALSTNDLGVDDGATFKAHMQQLIDRYRSVKPGMKFVLATTYDTNRQDAKEADGTLREVAFNTAMDELATENTGVLFINMYDRAGEWASFKDQYLADGIHPNQAGSDYFAGLQWDLLSQAASVPEPALAGAAFFACLLLHRRRARR